MVEALDERTHSWLTQMVRQLCSVPVMEPQSYRQHLVGVLLVLAQQGKKVVLGRGANFVLREALNVRLEASEGFRVHETMKREGIGHADALRQVHQVDLDRARFSRSVFQQDVDDRKTYDMVLRTDELGYDAAAAAIVGAARVMFGAQ
jgi:cytidylate kinase